MRRVDFSQPPSDHSEITFIKKERKFDGSLKVCFRSDRKFLRFVVIFEDINRPRASRNEHVVF